MTPRILSAAFLSLAFFVTPTARAQQQQTKHEYHIKIEKDVNGKTETIDKTFNSKADMDAFMNTMPDVPAPPTPPVPPPAPPVIINESENDDSGAEQYRLYLVNNENGKSEITDERFNSKAEMEAYMKEHHIETPDLPGCDIDVVRGKQCKKMVIVNTDVEDGDTPGEINVINNDGKGDEKVIIEKNTKPGKNPRTETIIIKSLKSKPHSGPPTGADAPKPMGNISNITLYPNPTKSLFHVAFTVGQPTDVHVRISDLNGKQVYNETFKDFSGAFSKDIDRPELTAGTYLLEVEAGGEKEATQVVVQ